jgi:hypothetical protein
VYRGFFSLPHPVNKKSGRTKQRVNLRSIDQGRRVLGV